MMENGPIFIGGLDRSGKTLLRQMLGRHPRLALTRKTYMWSRYYNQYGDLSQLENLERCLQAMLKQKTLQAFQPDVDRIRREFGEGPATYERLFDLFHKHNAERLGKPRWGDQLKLVERFAETIFTAYPDAKMIHMVRDPRDRYTASLANLSRRRKNERPDWRAGWSVARWRYSARLAERNHRRFPDRYLVLRYETLQQDPGATLKEVCDFLGEAFDPCLLEVENDPEQGAEEREDLLVDQRISVGETAFAQMIASREMRRLGYGLEPVQFSVGKAAAFTLVDLPLNLAGMMYWQLIEGRNFNG
jgi:hypothetical protein